MKDVAAMFHPCELEQQIEAQRQAAQVPGVAVAVVQGWQVVYTHGFGTTNVEDVSSKARGRQH